MGELVKSGSKYTYRKRMEVAVLYAISGNMKKVAAQCGIPRTTLVGWKQTAWWEDAIARVRSEKADEHRAQYSELVDKAQKVALDKLPDATAREAMTIAAIGTDKIRLHDGMPDNITARSDDMGALMEKFRQISREWDDRRIVATQDETEEDD